MSKLLSTFKRAAIDSFIADVGSSNNFYVFTSGLEDYPTSDVSLEVESTDFIQDTWSSMMFGKKPNFARLTNKYKWTSGTVYEEYSDSLELKGTEFYVLTADRDVFKCIYNNRGAPSTVKPIKTAAKLGVPIQTADGYEWVYLYNISKSDETNFVTANYMPVLNDTDVQAAAIVGGLFNIKITAPGSLYPNHEGTIASVTNTTVFQLQTGASANVNYYKDSSIAIKDPGGETHVRKIFYSAADRFVTLETDVPSDFLSTSCSYVIGPTVEIISPSGTGAVGYAIVDENDGSVSKVQMVEYGQEYYSDTVVNLIAGTGFGSGALAHAVASPTGGHGSNALDELFVDSLGVHCLFDEYGVGNTFNASVTYRRVGIIKNPAYANGALFTSNTFNQISTINILSNDSFANGEVVSGQTSGAQGRYAYSNSSVILLAGVSGQFLSGEVIQGSTSNSNTILSSNSTPTDLKLQSGEVLYVQNIQDVTRSVSSKEQLKLVIQF